MSRHSGGFGKFYGCTILALRVRIESGKKPETYLLPVALAVVVSVVSQDIHVSCRLVSAIGQQATSKLSMALWLGFPYVAKQVHMSDAPPASTFPSCAAGGLIDGECALLHALTFDLTQVRASNSVCTTHEQSA